MRTWTCSRARLSPGLGCRCGLPALELLQCRLDRLAGEPAFHVIDIAAQLRAQRGSFLELAPNLGDARVERFELRGQRRPQRLEGSIGKPRPAAIGRGIEGL